MKHFAAALLAVLAAPGVARAADTTLVSRDVPLRGDRALASETPELFDLVGLHWQGTGTVRFRTHGVGGGWSAWRRATPEADDLPNPGAAEARRLPGWRIGNPYWTGRAERIQYRLAGDVRRLRAHFVRSPAALVPLRTVSMAVAPAVLPRLAWSANERITRGSPVYADALRFAVVHHTAGSNRYTRAQSAAIVRAIQVYHVLGNRWNDVGYNFLVDKYGQVFEGRSGGIDRNVVGAHAQGFNTGSVGVAVLGNYGSATVTPATVNALARLLAWRLDLAHVDPLSTLMWLSAGNPRFRAGSPVFLRAIAGHRDTGFTSCPGNVLYARIPRIARAAAATGLPKLYAPTVRGSIGRSVRFTAQLTAAIPWTVTVYSPAGAPLALGSGAGAAVDWTWDARGAVTGRYTYLISAGPDVRSAFGTFGGKAPPLRLTGASAVPAVFSPNGDGYEDSTTVSYTLSVTATVTATLLDSAGTTLSTLFTDWKPAGRHSFAFSADGIADGGYTILLRAVGPDGKTASARVPVGVDRALVPG